MTPQPIDAQQRKPPINLAAVLLCEPEQLMSQMPLTLMTEPVADAITCVSLIHPD